MRRVEKSIGAMGEWKKAWTICVLRTSSRMVSKILPWQSTFFWGAKRNIGKARNRIRITEEDQEQKTANNGSKPSNQEQPKALP